MADKHKDKEKHKDEDMHDAPTEGADGEGAEGAEGSGKKSKKKLLIMIGGAVVLLLAVGAGLYFSGILGKSAEETAEHAEGSETHGEAKGGDSHANAKAKKGEGHGEEAGGGASESFVEIPPMLVNLNAEDGAPRYLRLTVQLELENPADKAAVQAIIPRVIDQFQTYLRELRVKDLRGSAGIYRLQMELLWRVNRAAEPVKIKDILFQEILIQ